jgi:hypothetical protein
MNGDAWEEYCQKLLRLKHPDYQEVPAQFGGDFGIEGFTRSGIVFQCYSPDEDLGGVELYEKQRDKMTRDIKKLIKNVREISKLGAGLIREWHFLTPQYNNRELVAHCRDKELTVRDRGLPQVDSGFLIFLRTEEDYLPQIRQLVGVGAHRVHPLADEPASEELERLLNSSNLIVSNIRDKLGKLHLPLAQNEELVHQLVAGYAAGRSELEALNGRFPEIYSTVIQLKASKERQLGVRVLASSGGHGAVLSQALDEYEEKLTQELSGTLTAGLIARLSTEAVSDWLGRCPLDFPVLGSN